MLDGLLAHRRHWLERLDIPLPPFFVFLLDNLETTVLIMLCDIDDLPRRSLLLLALGLRWLEGGEL